MQYIWNDFFCFQHINLNWIFYFIFLVFYLICLYYFFCLKPFFMCLSTTTTSQMLQFQLLVSLWKIFSSLNSFFYSSFIHLETHCRYLYKWQFIFQCHFFTAVSSKSLYLFPTTSEIFVFPIDLLSNLSLLKAVKF